MEYKHKPEVAELGVAFTRFVIFWNDLEDAARAVLLAMASHQTVTRALLLHQNPRGLIDALKAIADWCSGPESIGLLGEHITHFAKGFDELRLHRNFYVHSLRGMGKDPLEPSRFHANIYSMEARGKFSWTQYTISANELNALTRDMLRFANYGRGIAEHAPTNSELADMLRKRPATELVDLPKPDLPAKLQKEKRSFANWR